jgi:hypothetical protein
VVFVIAKLYAEPEEERENKGQKKRRNGGNED